VSEPAWRRGQRRRGPIYLDLTCGPAVGNFGNTLLHRDVEYVLVEPRGTMIWEVDVKTIYVATPDEVRLAEAQRLDIRMTVRRSWPSVLVEDVERPPGVCGLWPACRRHDPLPPPFVPSVDEWDLLPDGRG
jgi:hypothetical protein